MRRRFLHKSALTFALALILATCGVRSSPSGESLVERDDVQLDAPEGRYAAFASAEARSLVEMPEGAKRAFTPPFPGRLRLDVAVPESGRLVFHPALVSQQEVRRAIVDFVLSVDGVVVFTETLDFSDANRWLERDVDLSAFAGRDVSLVFETRPFRGGADKLWADRIQTAWGDPVLVRGGRGDRLDDVASGSIRELTAWLRADTDAGTRSFDASALLAFASNLLLAGGLAFLIRALYLRLGGAGASRAFANLFPLFTVTTVLVITVVEVSLALSLGLLGALSIVRFRTSIKTPEEITYLLFCVGVGLSLGAGARGLSVLAVVGVALFELLRRRLPEAGPEGAFVLTVSGDADAILGAGPGSESESVMARLAAVAPDVRFQRMERDGDEVALTTVVRLDDEKRRALPRTLAAHFPGLDIACVDADAVG